MGNLKTFTKMGLENSKGEVIIPAQYGDIDYIPNYLGVIQNKSTTTISAPIYLAYKQPYYDIYTVNGKIECPFKIKFYCVKNGVLVGLLDSEGNWHITAVDLSNSTIKVLYQNIGNITAANYKHVVFHNDTSDFFVYSLEEQKIILQVSECKDIILHENGIFVIKENGLEGLYDYSGNEILKCKWKELIVMPSNNLIRCKNQKNLYGLFTFKGTVVFACSHSYIEPHIVHLNKQKYFIFDITHDYLSTHALWQLHEDLNATLIDSNFNNIEFFDCGKVVIKHCPTKSCLSKFTITDSANLVLSELLSADKIQPLYQYSTKHFSVYNKLKVGVCDLQGKIIIPIKYTNVETNSFNDQVFARHLLGWTDTFSI